MEFKIYILHVFLFTYNKDMEIQKSRKFMRKQTKRNVTKRKTMKTKQTKKIVHNTKKYYGGKFNLKDEKKVRKSLKRFDFNKKELKEVIEKLGLGAHYFSGKKGVKQLISQYRVFNDKEQFKEWLDEEYEKVAEDDETDWEDWESDESAESPESPQSNASDSM